MLAIGSRWLPPKCIRFDVGLGGLRISARMASTGLHLVKLASAWLGSQIGLLDSAPVAPELAHVAPGLVFVVWFLLF